ncbi:hypothetical protein [Cryptosporangium minutisporangium]|uniref:PH domain-containing protein n=1 Tax=Cryptosporangium minutisporangium TaxID=113569 RepID=A0ABP6T5E1_9ACTN
MADEIRGRRPLRRWELWLYVVVVTASVAGAVVGREWYRLFVAVVWAVGVPLAWEWRDARVSPDGISLSWPERLWRRLPEPLIPWERVEGVERPDHSSAHVRVRLTNGRIVALVGIYALQAEAVAALGGKELLAPPPRVSVTGDKPRTQRDFDRELHQREAALAAERAELNAELERIRRRRSG